MTEKPALRPKEGWHVLHLFYRVEFGQWQLLTSEEKLAAKTHLSALVQEIRSLPSTQILTFSIVSPKADVGFMLLTDDLHTANSLEKKLTLSLGADLLTPVFGFYSLTAFCLTVTLFVVARRRRTPSRGKSDQARAFSPQRARL